MVFVSPVIDIAAFSAILVVISKVIQSKLVDKKKMKEMQQKSKEKQQQIKSR